MRRPFRKFLLCSTLAACGTATPTGTGTPVDQRTTGQLASDKGSTHVAFFAGTKNPSTPLLVSFDGRVADSIRIPHAEKRYDLGAGAHTVSITLSNAKCDFLGELSDGSTLTHTEMLTVSSTSPTFYVVSLDCDTPTTEFSAIASTAGVVPNAKYSLSMSSARFGTKQFDLPVNGSISLGVVHAGWYHFALSDVPSSCIALGPGVPPLPPGWSGTQPDSVEFTPSGSTKPLYVVNCP